MVFQVSKGVGIAAEYWCRNAVLFKFSFIDFACRAFISFVFSIDKINLTAADFMLIS